MSNRMGETLDLALALEGRTKAAPENAQLVVIAEALSSLPDPQIDTSFMLALEQRLLTEEIAGQQPARTLTVVPSTAPAPVREVRRAPVVQMPKRRFVVRRSLVAVAAAASLAAFPVVAAAQALPGSPFHSIKLKIEQVLIAAFGTPTEDMFSHMTLADRRMDEVEQLIETGGDVNDIALGLYLVKSELNKASALIGQTDDPAVLRAMADQAYATEMRLRQAASGISQTAGDEFAGALGTSMQIQNDIAEELGLGVVIADPQQVAARIASSLGTRDGDTGSRSQMRSPSGRDSDDGSKPSGGGDDTLNPGKPIEPVEPGCYIPGSAEGFGDLLAPVARMKCSI